jgi:hypothetical protein
MTGNTDMHLLATDICGHRRVGVVQIRMNGGLAAVGENPALEEKGN